MTVQSLDADITYTFNGEGQYPLTFDILKPKDVTVQFIDSSGVRHVLAMGTDYLVVDNAGSRYIEIISTCGFIGQPGQLFIFRDMPVEQPTDWVNNEELDMELLEKSFDRIIMILQQFNTQMTSELAAITWRAGWKTGTVYEARDLVQAPNSSIYLATKGHTAGVFETDLLAGYWNLVIDVVEIAGYAEAADVARIAAEAYSLQAEAWAHNDQGIPPDPLEPAEFSSKAYATESKEYATQVEGVLIHKADGTTQLIDSAFVSATKAAASQAAALASKNAAALSASSASASAVAADTSADLAALSAANLPNATTAGADKVLVTNSSGDGWDYIAIDDKLVLRDANGTAKFGAPTDPEHPMRLGDTSLRENVKVTVGAGGDFPTINAAVLHLSRFTPDRGVTAEVELQGGFVMEEQLFVEGLDLGWITITGVDAETVINEPSLTRVLVDDHKPAFGVENGTLPTIGQLFSFSSKGNVADRRSGVMARSVGSATILPGCGVRNAGMFGIAAFSGSAINAAGADASGAGDCGISADGGSAINAAGADASGAGDRGISADGGSTIDARSANASSAGDRGISSDGGSTIGARSADASSAGTNGIHAGWGSAVDADDANVSGAGNHGIYATRGSTINAQGANASSTGASGIYVQWGSTINAQGATGTLSQAKNTVTGEGIIFQP